jgi:hypothetical protein
MGPIPDPFVKVSAHEVPPAGVSVGVVDIIPASIGTAIGRS